MAGLGSRSTAARVPASGGIKSEDNGGYGSLRAFRGRYQPLIQLRFRQQTHQSCRSGANTLDFDDRRARKRAAGRPTSRHVATCIILTWTIETFAYDISSQRRSAIVWQTARDSRAFVIDSRKEACSRKSIVVLSSCALDIRRRG
jgi:hypothetical protein